MDPSLQEFYSLSRSTSIQQRPLSQADALTSRSSSRQQARRPESQQYQGPTGSIYAWPSSYHPFSVPSIAQISIPQPYRNSYQENLAPEDGRSSHRRHHTASAGYFGAGGPPIPRPQSRGERGEDLDDLIQSDPLGTSPTPISMEYDRYPYPQDEEAPRVEHLEDLDYYAGDYIPGVEGGRRLSNVYDPNPHAQRRGNGDPRGLQGDEEDAFEQNHDFLEEDLNQPDPHGFSPDPTPLPKIPLFVLSVVIFSEPLTSTILFPFVYFMVRDFHITENEEEIGFFCGLIASSFFFAQFCTSIFWGYMSDRYGRRPILLLGLIGSTIACLFFGLSKSLIWAITSRSMCGLLNGNVGVAKSMLGEIADSTNQSQAFSIFGFAWGIGMIVGPVLGGFLANPAQNFPDTFGHWPFFIKYPYFLPCLVAAIGSVVGFTVGYFFLEETNGRNNLPPKAAHEPDQFPELYEERNFIPNEHPHQDQQGQDDERRHIVAPSKTTARDSEAVDIERQPLTLPPNATQPQQVKFVDRRYMGASNQYGSMSTLAHEAGAISPTGSPYRGHPQNDYSVSARSTLSHRPAYVRPGLFHQHTSGSGSTSGGSGAVFASSYNDRRPATLYSYSRPLSTGGLFSLTDSSSQGRRGSEVGIDIPADATMLTFNGFTNDPLGSRGGYTGANGAVDSGRISRMSMAPSQVFLLPPDPNNKDPNQPLQLVVIQSPETGLSPLSITTIVAYAMLALHSIVFEEVYTLYAVTPLVSHGLGWTAMQLSTSLAVMGFAQLVLQFIVYPKLERRFSAVWLFRAAQLLYCCVYLTFPMIRRFAVDENDTEAGGQSRMVRNLVLVGLVLKYVCSVSSYTSVMVMITNSAPAHLLGTVNGIGQTSASFMRAFGPALGGILWAWSLSNKLEFPFNYFFVFFLMGTIALLGFVHSLSIPKELGRRRM